MICDCYLFTSCFFLIYFLGSVFIKYAKQVYSYHYLMNKSNHWQNIFRLYKVLKCIDVGHLSFKESQEHSICHRMPTLFITQLSSNQSTVALRRQKSAEA